MDFKNDLNHVILTGRLTRDPELKYTNSGLAVCQFDIAVNKKYKKDNEEIKKVLYITVKTWGKSAENFNQYKKKGDIVRVIGELDCSTWKDDQDKTHRKDFVNAVTIEYGYSDKKQDGTGVDIPEDDIPF
jgi:single-strand DNA-binding protein